MAAAEKLVLPDDVVIERIAELPEEIRDGLEHEEGDCAVTRPLSRGRSTVVDAPSAELLERFRTPATIVEAVIDYSAAAQADPRTTLDDAFEMLCGLAADGMLVAAGSELSRAIAPSLHGGERVGAFELLEPVHLIVDTEVHLAKASDGALAAVKIARAEAGRQIAVAFAHEAAVLERLDGEATPRLLEAGVHEDRPFLAISWSPGVDALHAANDLRRLGSEGREPLLALAASVVSAYDRLHGRGIAHGDVHPRNVLVEFDGTVRLIDFGLAMPLEAAKTPAAGPRGGIDLFMEPEAAAAQLAGGRPPALSARGEQYSVAALVYLLLSGEHTHDFSLEHEQMLRQLVELPAHPFESRAVSGLPAVEEVVQRGLAKDPMQRHRSMAAFHRALRTAAARDLERPARGLPEDRPEHRDVLGDVLGRLAAPDGELFAAGLAAPTASAMNGGAGFAYALLRIAGIREDESLLALADLWAVRAGSGREREEAFWNADLEIVPETFGERSFYHHLAGVECVLALVAAARGDEWAGRLALQGFLDAAAGECEHVDVAFGKAGLLIGASLLFDSLPDPAAGEPLRATGASIRDALWEELEEQPPLGAEPELRSLGAAHGWAGCLFAILRWSEASATPTPAGLEHRLDQLGALARPFGRGLRWPYDAGTPMPHTGLEASWCNGAAGFVFLWAAAGRVLGGDRFEQWARRAGWTAYESPTPAVSDLCCGYAGRAYALLCLFRLTEDEAWLARARLLTRRAAEGIGSDALRRDSLYKGEVGVALLAADLERPEHARMPLFEGERGRL